MTSWRRRIDNVKKVVGSIMDGTVKPDKLFLNLSEEEFKGTELPKDLVEFFEKDDRLVINWVPGEDTKSMKKVFPILKHLEDDDIIITADDDILFPKDLVESRLADFDAGCRKYAITSNTSRMGMFPGMYVASACSLYTKKMLKNWERFVDGTVVRTYNDDRTYLYILWFNGYFNRPCSKHNVKELVGSYGLGLDDSSMTKNHIHAVAKNYDTAVEHKVREISDKPLREMFGYFRNGIHDCVLVYEKSYGNTSEMTCGDRLEVEYAIGSLRKFCKSWLGRIFVVGSEPPAEIADKVIHVPCDNPFTHCKDSNIIHKLLHVCKTVKDLSDDFLMVSDDQIVTRECSWEDFTPRVVRRYTDWSSERWEKSSDTDPWHKWLLHTLRLFPEETSCFWEPHIWSPMNKKKFIEMCEKYDYTKDTYITQSLYYNFIGQKYVKNYDHIYLGNKNGARKARLLNMMNKPTHVAWTDDVFREEMFRKFLEDVLGLETIEREIMKNKYDMSYERIMDFRRRVSDGSVMKVKNGGGKSVWKRIR